MISLQNKNVLVTGGSRGIGKACVKLFLKAGANVAFTFQSAKNEADKVSSHYSGSLKLKQYKLNLAVTNDIEKVIGFVLKDFGLHAKGRAKTQRTLGNKSSTAEHAPPIPAFFVDRFIEKPDLETAKKYVASGNYLWNSGMFMFTASAYLKELTRFAPDILASCRRAYKGSRKDLDFLRLDDAAFSACPSDSID